MAVYRAYASVLIDADSEEEAIERALRIYDSNTFDYVELEDEEREKTNKIISEDSVEELIPFEDKEYIVERVNKIIDAIPEIDKAIDEVAVGWKTDRMGKVELSILRLAYYEMAMDDEVPGKVAVDQAVILAKKYGSDNAPAFINGILAKLFQE